MNVPFRKRCKFCHAKLEATPVDLLPKIIGRPQVRCSRCGRVTKLSLLVSAASSAAGAVFGAGSMLVCTSALAGSIGPMPLGAVALLFLIGLAAGLVGYIAFAACCYFLQSSWNLLSGPD